MQAIVHFEKAAGAFKYLESRFSSAPSQDMRHETLTMLVGLMLVSDFGMTIKLDLCCVDGYVVFLKHDTFKISHGERPHISCFGVSNKSLIIPGILLCFHIDLLQNLIHPFLHLNYKLNFSLLYFSLFPL